MDTNLIEGSMDYINAITGTIMNIEEIRTSNPHISIPNNADLTSLGYEKLHQLEMPKTSKGYRIEVTKPAKINGRWQRGWRQVQLDENEKMELIASSVPAQVSMKQFRLALLYAGLLNTIESGINEIQDPILRQATKIEWEYDTSIKRDKEIIKTIASVLDLSIEQVWDLLKYANSL